jgi:hypothetical protein
LAAKLASRQAKARILSASYDEALRRTRQLLLKAQGYDVISTDRLESTLEQCKLGGFDLFVLGHSIPQEDVGRPNYMNHLRLTNAIAAFSVAAALCLSAPINASADSRSHCQRRVENAREHYRHEIHKHGKHSRQAENAKAKLNAVWDRCWTEAHAWYDPNRHEWRTERDWDRTYDWDRERDRYDH